MTTPADTPTQKPSSPPSTPTETKSRHKIRRITGIGVSIGLIALILLGGLFWQTHWRSQQTYATQVQQQITQLQTQLAQLADQYQTLEQRMAQQTQSLQAVFTQHPALNQQWELVTVQDLLQQAYLTLYWQKNIPTALQLLTRSKDMLQAMGDPAVYPIRDQLAQEISALNTVPVVHRDELLTQLHAIAQQFSQLPALTVAPTFSSVAPDTAVEPPPTDKTSWLYWRVKLQTLWQPLSQLMVIRHHPQPIEPLLSTAQRQLLEQQLVSLMQQAQWAVLQHRAEVYEQSLIQVVHQMHRYFDSQQPMTQQVLQQLQALQQVNIDPKLPDIHQSLQQVQQLLKQYLAQPITEQTS